MARPLKAGMDYFPHDTDASNDEKIEAIRALHGNDGYAFYFILCERVYKTPDAELDISKKAIEASLIKKVGVTADKFRDMLETAFEIELFCQEAYEDRQVLTSKGIKKRAKEVQALRERWRKQKEFPAENPRENPAENGEENAEETPERKEKKRKENDLNNDDNAREDKPVDKTPVDKPSIAPLPVNEDGHVGDVFENKPGDNAFEQYRRSIRERVTKTAQETPSPAILGDDEEDFASLAARGP